MIRFFRVSDLLFAEGSRGDSSKQQLPVAVAFSEFIGIMAFALTFCSDLIEHVFHDYRSFSTNILKCDQPHDPDKMMAFQRALFGDEKKRVDFERSRRARPWRKRRLACMRSKHAMGGTFLECRRPGCCKTR